jgi:hypothetical protein
MAKYKILAPIGGHQQKVWMPNETAKETDFRIPVADLIRDGFIALVAGSEDEVEGTDKEPDKDLNEGGGNEGSGTEGGSDAGAGADDEEDTTTREIKEQLRYEGIPFPENATKQELFQLYQNK